MTTIAVTGATGHLGRLAVAALKAKGAAPVALARSPEKAADLGVETRAFDYTRPDPAALKGVEVLVLISSNDFTDRAGQHRAVIAAAKQAGVGRIVYTSILKGAGSPMLLAQDHIATEAALIESGIPHTVLRNGWYTENFTGALAAAVQHGAILGAAGEGKVSSASPRTMPRPSPWWPPAQAMRAASTNWPATPPIPGPSWRRRSRPRRASRWPM